MSWKPFAVELYRMGAGTRKYLCLRTGLTFEEALGLSAAFRNDFPANYYVRLREA